MTVQNYFVDSGEFADIFARLDACNAGIAQLVELHLAKVVVAGSSPVSRFSNSGAFSRFAGYPNLAGIRILNRLS